MESCPDCVEVKQRYSDNPDYELVDIGKQARSLKEFIVLRDSHPAFVKVRERGNIGIPCFIKEDGSVIISRYDKDGFHNLKSKGVAHNPNEYIAYIPVNETVYGPQRIVTATSDEAYTAD